MDADLKKLEEELQKLAPAALPDDLLSRLDEAMCRWHEKVPLEEKIISFSTAPTVSRKKFLSWQSAAAVAVFGGSVALWPGFPGWDSAIAATSSPPSSGAVFPISSRSPSPSSFVPVSATGTSNLVNTSDRGIVTLGNGQPARCVAIQFQDQLQFRNSNGELLKVDQPAFKIIFVPLKAD